LGEGKEANSSPNISIFKDSFIFLDYWVEEGQINKCG
jgi:hypothetical protein